MFTVLPLLFGCQPADPEPAPNWRWTDAHGRTVLHVGVNLNQTAKSRAGGYHHGLTDEDLALLPASGVTLVRLLAFWEAIEPVRGTYDEGYLEQVRSDVDALHALGLTVVLDLHQDVYGEGFGFTGFPRWTCSEERYAAFVRNDTSWFLNYASPSVIGCFDDFWASAELQEAYADAAAAVVQVAKPDALDVINEPYWASLSQADHDDVVLPAFYRRVAEAVRPVAPDLRLFLAPSVASNINQTTTFDPTSVGDSNVGFAPHFYPTYAEIGSGFDGDFSDESIVLADFARIAADAEAPLFVGEFGIFSTDGNEPDYVRDVLAAVQADGGSAAYWAYDRGRLLTADGAPGPLMPAFGGPWPHRIPGAFERVDPDGTARFALDGPGELVYVAVGDGASCAVDGADVVDVHRDGAQIIANLDGHGEVTARCE